MQNFYIHQISLSIRLKIRPVFQRTHTLGAKRSSQIMCEIPNKILTAKLKYFKGKTVNKGHKLT